MMPTAVPVGEEKLHGRNKISSRAIRSVVSAITAGELDTAAKTVAVELSDENGGLTVTVSAPITIAPLLARDGFTAQKGVTAQRRPTGTVLERAAAAQNTIRERVLELTGSTAAAVNLRLTEARIEGGVRLQ
ncbi:hypothetical protein B0I08_11277 [Glaciihabitans tibetensis]|uniref:Uncharacterized protein n=1 Tax=Glaciihabitans tibetensis TaxID=1266600 RepID=A0A2T0V3E5_9MICO|nr:hypothetical protein [Glaciihabitans tibetensis]PRY64692.1 hypothetical protein B0I08_11277 [Glaciihabitans tibetensis]